MDGGRRPSRPRVCAMTRPGLRLREFAARLCSSETMARFIDPMVADLQSEQGELRGEGAIWTARWMRLVWLFAFVNLLALMAVHTLLHAFDDWTPNDTSAARRAAAIFTVATIVPLTFFVSMGTTAVPWTRANRALLALYLVPSAFPVSLAVGVTFAVVCGLGRERLTRHRVAATMCAAVVCAMAMFANLAWVVPDSNQAYRELVFGGPVAR